MNLNQCPEFVDHNKTPEGNLKWLAATSAAGTPDLLAAAETYFFNRIGRSLTTRVEPG